MLDTCEDAEHHVVADDPFVRAVAGSLGQSLLKARNRDVLLVGDRSYAILYDGAAVMGISCHQRSLIAETEDDPNATRGVGPAEVVELKAKLSGNLPGY
jgi:hypothetical protein